VGLETGGVYGELIACSVRWYLGWCRVLGDVRLGSSLQAVLVLCWISAGSPLLVCDLFFCDCAAGGLSAAVLIFLFWLLFLWLPLFCLACIFVVLHVYFLSFVTLLLYTLTVLVHLAPCSSII
jgi:hypothetical protein